MLEVRNKNYNHTWYIVHSTLYFLLLAFSFSGCGVYSFSEGSIAPDVKTISIDNFYNEAGNGPANLGQLFSEKLRTYYQQNTRLGVIKNNGDWHLEGRIVSFGLSPVSPQGESSAFTRLTIGVQVKFINIKDEKANFDQPFSFYEDFPNTQTPSDAEPQLVETITEKIVYDIFTRTTSNW